MFDVSPRVGAVGGSFCNGVVENHDSKLTACARLAQGPLQSLKALDPDLHKPDFEAPDPRNLQNHAKTNMYRFGPKNLACEARQRSLHNAGTLTAPTAPRNRSCNFSRKG
jgi:hypothetical protein